MLLEPLALLFGERVEPLLGHLVEQRVDLHVGRARRAGAGDGTAERLVRPRDDGSSIAHRRTRTRVGSVCPSTRDERRQADARGTQGSSSAWPNDRMPISETATVVNNNTRLKSLRSPSAWRNSRPMTIAPSTQAGIPGQNLAVGYWATKARSTPSSTKRRPAPMPMNPENSRSNSVTVSAGMTVSAMRNHRNCLRPSRFSSCVPSM